MIVNTPSNEIILITPRERVTGALKLTSAFCSGIAGLGLLYAASPVALLAGCALIIKNSVDFRKTEAKCAEDKMRGLMPPGNVWSPIFDELSTAAGIRKPIRILTAQHGENPTATVLNDNVFAKMPIPDKENIGISSAHIVSHEFGHIARGDTSTEIKFFALSYIYSPLKRLSALCSAALLPFGAWPTALTLGSAAILFHLVGIPFRKIDKESEPVNKKHITPISEMETERVAFELTGLPVTPSIYTTQSEMVKHCSKIGAPLPPAFAHMPKPEPAARIHQIFNRICGILCRPKTMARPAFCNYSLLAPLFHLHRAAKPGTDLHDSVLSLAADQDARIVRGRNAVNTPLAPVTLSPELAKRIRIY